MWACRGRRWVSAALTITNIHSASQCLPNIARGAEHTVAGCRYQCYQRRGLAGVPSAAPGLRPRSSRCSLRVVTPARCVNVTGPSRAWGRQGKWIQQKKIGLRQKGQSRRETMELFVWGRGTWPAEGHDRNEPCIERSGLEHYTSVGKIAVKGYWYCSGPSSLLQ